MLKNIPKYFWLSFVPYTILGVLTIALLVLGTVPLWYLWLTLLGWILIAGLGIAVGYHRVFAHGNYPDLPRWKENILLFLGTMGGQDSSILWCAIHRGYHHRWSDTDRDMHTPRHGIYHAFVGWTRIGTDANPTVNVKFAGPILRRSNHQFFHKYYFVILWMVPLLVAIIDWKISLVLLCLPTCIAIWQDNLINVLGHVRGGIGYRNFDIGDRSHNNPLLAYIGWGQGWHNNHHHSPGSFDFGRGISGKWWEIDPCVIFKPLLR